MQSTPGCFISQILHSHTPQCVVWWYSRWIHPLTNSYLPPAQFLLTHQQHIHTIVSQACVLLLFCTVASVYPSVIKCACFCTCLCVNMCKYAYASRVRLATYSYRKLRYSTAAAGKCIWVTFEVSASADWVYTLVVPTCRLALQDVIYSVYDNGCHHLWKAKKKKSKEAHVIIYKQFFN